jgi:hypothetical protein
VPRARKPFWTVDCESDPFESDAEAVARRACPECGQSIGDPCKGSDYVHEKRRRIPAPFIWGLYGGPDGDEYHEFDIDADLVRFLESRNHVVYAHNGGKFDYHYLKQYVNTGESISIIGGRLARFRIGECEFRDSMNILPVALGEFKKDEMDYSIMEPGVRDEPRNRETIRKYLRGDCTYLYELIEAHRKENGVVLTQASASMKAWLKQSKKKRPKQTAARYQQYKPYYYGGRVQCFEQGIGKRPFKVYDINSAYPRAMLEEHPFSPVAQVRDRLPPDGEIHKCMITLSATARGCFPFRLGEDETKGDLFFPFDEREIRRYHVTGYEFISALKCNAVTNISIETVHYFEETTNFREFILKNWDRRAKAKESGDKALSIIVKLLMNSLYGKFASDYNKYRDYQLCHGDEIGELEVTGFMQDADWSPDKFLMSRPIPEEKHKFYNIATAASITGYVRAMLFEAMQKVDGLLYCDTDSLACADGMRLAQGDGLGEWKEEGSFDEYAIAGKKTYAFHKAGLPQSAERDSKKQYLNWKCASKGVDLSPAKIFEAAQGQSVIYNPKVPTYSVKAVGPKYIPRRVKLTAKDIRKVPI